MIGGFVMIRCEQIALTNWKNFGGVSVTLTDRAFVIGANAAGKSNFLDAFRFLKDVTNNGLQKAVNSRGGISKIRNLNARSPSYIEISIKLSETEEAKPEVTKKWEYLLQFNAAGGKSENRDVNVSREIIVEDGTTIKDRKYNDTQEDYLSRQFTLLEQPASNNKFRPIYEFFRNISYVNIIPQLIREADSFIPSNSTEDYYGRSLLETIASAPKKTRDSRLNTISRILKMAVPQFSDLKFILDNKGKPHLQVKYHHFRPQGAYQREDQFSDGTLRLLGLIWAILDGEGLLLLEEPELYLHSAIVQQLPMFIANAQKKNKKGRQVIISSHSFDLLNTDTIAPEEVLLLQQNGEDTSIKPANTVDEVVVMINAGYTPADAVIPQVIPEGIRDGQLSLFDFS